MRALPGAHPDRVEDAAELLVATVFFRSIVRGRKVTKPDLRRIVDTVTLVATSPGPSRRR